MDTDLVEKVFEDRDERRSYMIYVPIEPIAGRFREVVNVPTDYGYDFLLRRITVKWGETGRGDPVNVTIKGFEQWRDRTFEVLDIPLSLITSPGETPRNAGGDVISGQRKLHKSINYLFARRANMYFHLEGWGPLAGDLPGKIDVLLEGVYIRAKVVS